MGQRTSVIIVTENKNGRRNVKVYHDQWGIGRKSFLDLMTIANAVYNLDYDADICEQAFIPKNVSRAFQIYELEYDGDGACYQFRDSENQGEALNAAEAPEWKDWFESKGVGEFIRHWCDNNNGGMVVYIKETKDESGWRGECHIEAKWLLGTEDEFGEYERFNGEKEFCNVENECFGEAYSMFLTANEYAGLDINRSYADEEFMNVVTGFCKYFEIKID